MATLKSKAEAILAEKTNKIIPENIKAGVQIFDVEGILSGSGDVKLFETVEQMQQDTTSQDGDLAIVYREEIQPVTEESEFDSCIFPNTVILDEAFTDSIYGSFRAINDGWFDGNVSMSPSNFRFNGYGESVNISISYTSSDGITYTRTDGGEELQEFGTIIKWENYEPWNDVIGKFMKIGENYFEGLYKYNVNLTDKTKLNFIYNIVSPQTPEEAHQGTVISFDTKNQAYVPNLVDFLQLNITNYYGELYCFTNNYKDFYIYYGGGIYVYSQGTELGVGQFDGYDECKLVQYNIDTGEHTITPISKSSTTIGGMNDFYKLDTEFDYTDFVPMRVDFNNKILLEMSDYWYHWSYYSGRFSMDADKPFISSFGLKNEYIISKNQLDTTADLVYEKTFYGKNGVEIGTLGTPDNSFADGNAEVFAKIKNSYENMTPRILVDGDTINKNIYFIPTNSAGTTLLDTSNVTDMSGMFMNCSNLKSVPLLNTNNVTNMSTMFMNCSNLKSVSLTGTSNVTDMGGMFEYCSSLTSLPQLDTSNVTSMDSTFQGCVGLTTIPQLDTSSNTKLQYTFRSCSNLVSLPLLNTSKVDYINDAFGSCPLLDSTSLNNILAMCINSIVTSNKTLKYIGLSQEQAQICTTLSNYQDFANAGWTTGY